MSASAHSAATKSHTDFAPGYTDSRGHYRPTSAQVKAYQAARVTAKDHEKFGYWTSAALVGLLVVFMGLNVFWRIKTRRRQRPSPRKASEDEKTGADASASAGTRRGSRWYVKSAAAVRWLSYPRLRSAPCLRHVWTLGPLGPNILIFFGLVLTSCLEFVNKYYFFPNWYGAAPLFLRAAWIALACLPFIFVLGSKRNLVAFLTGVPHHHLQVLHQGLALVFTYMSIVHSVAAVIRATRDYGFILEFKYNIYYRSGALCFAALIVLFAGALPFLRRMAYELFWLLHITMAIVFLGALCWHCYDERHAYVYFNTTIALFCFSFVSRFVMMLLHNPKPHLATAKILDETTLSLTMPTRMTWRAGAHVFVRILEVRPLESHPFSILSPPPSIPESGDTGLRGRLRWRRKEAGELQLLIRRRDGFTAALFERAAARGGQCRFRCIVDGPYGGHVGLEHGMDGVLCVAAGSGITGVLGLVQQMAVAAAQASDAANGAQIATRTIRLVWAVRSQDALQWINQSLRALGASMAHVDIQIHITAPSSRGSITTLLDDQTLAGDSGVETPQSPSSSTGCPEPKLASSEDVEKGLLGAKFFPTSRGWSIDYGRPDLKGEITRWTSEQKGNLAVVVCGPTAFSADVANAVTGVQRAILTGKYPDVNEMVLETESFGW